MTAQRVLIDTGAIYAYVTRTDAHHQAAKEFVQSCVSAHGTFLLTDLVFAETMTLLKSRIGTHMALKVGRALRESPVHAWCPLGPEGERDTWATFQRYKDKDWSYTDCALFSMAKSMNVKRIFGFDHHLDQMPGIIRVPRARSKA